MSRSDWQRGYDIGKTKGFQYGKNALIGVIVQAVIKGVVEVAVEHIHNRRNAAQAPHTPQDNQSQAQHDRS